MTPTITLKDIANEVNKTVVTVSKALRGHPDISKETREHIQNVAQKLGYTPNLIARKLSSSQTRSIGLVVPRIAHPFFSEAIEAIFEEARRLDYDIILMVTGEDEQLEIQNIQSLLAFQVDGLLISVTERTQDTAIFKTILDKGKKLVFFDRVIENLGCCSVVCDNFEGTYNLVKFALKNGYKKFGYFAGYKNNYIGTERRNGFEKALADNNIQLNPDWIIEGGFDHNDGYSDFMKLYETGNLPEIIITVSYAAALGAMSAIRKLDLIIPRDIDLMAFGDSYYNQFIKPSLTVARLDSREMGRQALAALINAIESKAAPSAKIVVPTKLIVNETGLG